jgi:hypothetical protein
MTTMAWSGLRRLLTFHFPAPGLCLYYSTATSGVN